MTRGIGFAAKSGYVLGLVLVILVIVIGVASLLYLGPSGTSTLSSSNSSSLTQPEMVDVFGLVSTTGAGTHPTAMIFMSETDSGSFEAPVSSGHFAIQLPNGDSYNVTIEWAGNFTWQRGDVGAGSLSVNKPAGSNLGQSYNIVAHTPDSVVTVNGTIPWQVVTSDPVNIRFTSSQGDNFTAPVSTGNSFSVRLPNMMNYEINIQSQNSTGFKDWFYAHTLQVSAGVNVLGLYVRISY